MITTVNRAIVFYDGGCNLCSREIRFYRKLDRAGRVEWQDINHDPCLIQKFGINLEDAMRRFHVLGSDGVMRVGAPAFLSLWQELPAFKLVSKSMYVLRLVPALDWMYEYFAEWRFRSRMQKVCAVSEE